MGCNPNPPNDPVIDPNASWKLQDICPEDMFERLQRAHHHTEDYNHLLARTLNDLCRCTFISGVKWVDGMPYLWDLSRSKWISLSRVTLQTAYYGLNQANRYLRVGTVTSCGAQGFLCPRPAVLTAIWAKSRSILTWTVEARKNGIPITLASANIINSFGSDLTLNVDVDAGDWLQVYLSGNSVDHPIAAVEFAWRLL